MRFYNKIHWRLVDHTFFPPSQVKAGICWYPWCPPRDVSYLLIFFSRELKTIMSEDKFQIFQKFYIWYPIEGFFSSMKLATAPNPKLWGMEV